MKTNPAQILDMWKSTRVRYGELLDKALELRNSARSSVSGLMEPCLFCENLYTLEGEPIVPVSNLCLEKCAWGSRGISNSPVINRWKNMFSRTVGLVGELHGATKELDQCILELELSLKESESKNEN